MISHLRLKAFGKINLALDVLGRKPDGYHEVRMIMQTVGSMTGLTCTGQRSGNPFGN